ncbi:small acid-soluble spore protein SspI [Paenibacillus sp. NPDC057886]|uniref:small acid-soluble spore protein SspI n=1 Tax=Paenibacillus sp. NPDC057886 TaxID=3346270 RepID=UPI00369EA1EF
MPITLSLREAIVHKVHDKSDDQLREMIEGSVDGPEAALPGLGAIFEMIWKNTEPTKQEELIQIAQEHLHTIPVQPIR